MPRPPRGTPGGRPANQPAGQAKGPLSLARALSKFGVSSRKEAERIIGDGRVTVNAQVVRVPARRIDPRADRIMVDGLAVSDRVVRVAVVLHKPVGYITSRTDPGGRATVYDLIAELPHWVFPVGRLDRDTSGLLVLTNDHQLGQRLTDPGFHVPKTYHAKVRGVPDALALQVLREGVPLEDGILTRPAGVRSLGASRDGRTWLEIVLREGRNRQVRRMCASIGHDVEELVRVRIGGLSLGTLAAGEWRLLAKDELERLLDRA